MLELTVLVSIILVALFYVYIKEKIEQNQKLPFDQRFCSLTNKIENREKSS